MANQYTLTNDFSAITETQGTLYNPSASNIELASAADTTPGQGILLQSGERKTFNGTLYARSMDDAATLNVSDFTEAGEGGGGSYTLPIASASTLGGIKVGNNLSIDPDTGVLSADASPYSLPTASSSVLGGVKIGSNLSIDGNGVLSGTVNQYTLPPATTSTLGGVIVGTNLSVDGNGVLSADAAPYTLPTATASVLGGVKIGDNIDVAADGTISAPKATASSLGVVSIGSGLSVDANGEITVDATADATTTSKGIVQVGNNINVASGVISVPAATASTLGVVSVGNGLSVNAAGELSADAVNDATKNSKGIVQIGDNINVNSGIITVPKATAAALGVVKPGSGLSVDSDGVLSATAYELPTASDTTLGGIKVGTNLSIDEYGVLSATGGGGDTANYQQINKYEVDAPLDVEIPLTLTTTFCLPPVEILKFAASTQDVITNIFTFASGDGSSFEIDGQSAETSPFVKFDGTVHLVTEQPVLFGSPTDIGDYDICISDEIDVSDFKSIEGWVV